MIRHLTNCIFAILCSVTIAACSSTQEERTESRKQFDSAIEAITKEATSTLFRYCWDTTDDQIAAIPKLLAEGFVEETTTQQRQNNSRFFKKNATTVILSNPFASLKLQRCTIKVTRLVDSEDFSRNIVEELNTRELEYRIVRGDRGVLFHIIPGAKKQIATGDGALTILREGLIF